MFYNISIQSFDIPNSTDKSYEIHYTEKDWPAILYDSRSNRIQIGHCPARPLFVAINTEALISVLPSPVQSMLFLFILFFFLHISSPKLSTSQLSKQNTNLSDANQPYSTQ